MTTGRDAEIVLQRAYRERREMLQEQSKRECCAVCGSDLLVANAPAGPTLRCGQCNTNGAATRPRYTAGLRQRYRRGESLNAIERQTLHHQLLAEFGRAAGAGELPRPQTLGLLNRLEEDMGLARYEEKTTALVDPEEAVRFLDFTKMANPDALRRHAIALIEGVGLNPGLGELMVYEGKLYVTVQGIGRIIGRYLDGIDPARYWSAAEKEAAGFPADDVVCSVTIYRKGATRGVTGTGRANATRPYRGNPVEKAHPQRFAENRALRHAYRLGCTDLLGRHGVDVLPEDIDEPTERPVARVVDVETGEIVAGDVEGRREEGTTESRAQVTAEQLTEIKAQQAKRHWSTAVLLTHIKAKYQADSLEALTEEQANRLVDYLEMAGSPQVVRNP